MTNLEDLFKERQELIKENYSSEEEYTYFLKKEGFHFLFFRNLANKLKEFYFIKCLDNKIHFISFIHYKFPMYNSFIIEDIASFKIYSNAFEVILNNNNTFYIGTKEDSNSDDEIKIASQILCKILSNNKKNNKVILSL